LYGKKINDIFCLRNDEDLADEHIARGEWTQAAAIFARITNPNVRVLNKHGRLLREHLNDLSGALECHQQALSKATDREKAETLMYLGKVYQSMEKYAEVFQVYSEALQWFENETKRDLSMIARCLVGMGTAQRARGRLDDALDCAERALAIREHEIKPKNDFDVAACLGNMGNILHDQGDIQRALLYATRAVDLLSACGKGDPRLAAALNNLGAMCQSDGDSVKAREYFERALESLPNENHPHLESTLANIAQLNIIEQSNE
jgi:tetratricopeptide (TPR) repeat protein